MLSLLLFLFVYNTDIRKWMQFSFHQCVRSCHPETQSWSNHCHYIHLKPKSRFLSLKKIPTNYYKTIWKVIHSHNCHHVISSIRNLQLDIRASSSSGPLSLVPPLVPPFFSYLVLLLISLVVLPWVLQVPPVVPSLVLFLLLFIVWFLCTFSVNF